MAEPAPYLMVRGQDMVVLAVRWEGCEVRPGTPAPTLVATGTRALVRLTFPPQAIQEQTSVHAGFHTDGRVYSDSRLAGTSELVFQVASGTVIELTVAGILKALARLDSSSAFEMPLGLKSSPSPVTGGPAVVSDHTAHPLAAGQPEVVSLWQARLRALDGDRTDARLTIQPKLLPVQSDIATSGQLFQTPPLHGRHPLIVERAAESPARVTRLELSALGGTLSVSAVWRDSSWSHEIVLGRDQKARVTVQGRLWPFGHRAVFLEVVTRTFMPIVAVDRDGIVAGLLARRVLIVLEPLRAGLRTPTFPFDEAEILGREFRTNSAGAAGDGELFMPTEGGKPLKLPFLCRSGNREVQFSVPVIFVGDRIAEPTAGVLTQWQPHATVDIPGMELDMVGGGLPGDIHEVHSLTLDGRRDGVTFRPDLRRFTVVLPALRALLPGAGHDAERTVVYAGELRTDERSVPAVPLKFDPPFEVDFTKKSERSGGLVAPRFFPDGISRNLGPVPSKVLHGPDLGAALGEAFRGATLFGLPLAKLIKTDASPRPGPPKITQRRVGGATVVEFHWVGVQLREHGPFKRKHGTSAPVLDLVVGSGPGAPGTADPPTTCRLSNFQLTLPQTNPLLTLAFDKVTFTQRPGEPMKLELTNLVIEFGGSLKLLQRLQKEVMRLLGQHGPKISVSMSEIIVGYQLRVPDAPAGMFVMRNVAVRTEVRIPFTENTVRVVIGFASRAQPFTLTVSGFGGGGYAEVELAGEELRKLELSLEFGAMVMLNFVIAKAEVHALGGVRFVRQGDLTLVEGYLRIGGSVELLGLITVSVELRVTLKFADPPPKLTGRASLVIELDLTLYSTTVTVDSGEYQLIGGADAISAPSGTVAAEHEAIRQAAWDDYWKAFA